MLCGVRGMLRLCWWAALAVALSAGARAPEPRLVCAPGQAGRCVINNPERNEYSFEVNGQRGTFNFVDGVLLILECWNTALDDPALPHFEPALRVREVRLMTMPPAAASYEAALRALNVIGPAGAPTYFIELNLRTVSNFNASVLAAMPTLRSLTLAFMDVAAADLALLPAGLERLALSDTKISRVSAAALGHLPHLSSLVMSESVPVEVEVEAASNLSSLQIFSSSTLVSLSLPDTLGSVELMNWAPRHPEPWRSCAGLVGLSLENAAVESLPDDWLVRCARLRYLRLQRAWQLTTLAPRVLRGAVALEEVDLSYNALETLPAGLLDDAPALRVLNLVANVLHSLPGDLFRGSKSLSGLDLSFNKLDESVLGALETVTSLNVLGLEYNRRLDACPLARDTEHGTAQDSLHSLKNLTRLSLDGTSTQRVCAAWRRLPRLERLNLRGRIGRLQYNDLQFDTTVNTTVFLDVGLSLRREDYESVAAAPAGPTLTLQLTRGSQRLRLRCDCELYWAVAALRHPNMRLRESGAYCDTGRELREVPLDALVCAAPGPCPARCSCATRGDLARPGPLLLLDCSGAGLSRVPRLEVRAVLNHTEAAPIALDINLANNSIDRLSPEDLPPELVALDLHANLLGVIDEATAAALVSRADRRVWLADNPLQCDCRAATALATMREHADVFSDWANATCSDGTPLPLAAPLPCDDGPGEPRNVTESAPKDTSGSMSGGAVAAVAVGVAAATGTLALVLARALLRRRVRAALRARPPSTLRLERLDAGEWLYDAFVSFAHADAAVVRELVERLERGPAPLRLCVHYRDWVPGGWIPTQIALSVRVSRRTVAVVSAAFLRSKWARAEFREAYAAALEDGEPRLVLVLLEDPARLPLDVELRAYVGGNTYLRWGEPWFWRKLRSALPPPGARPAAETPPGPPTPPPKPPTPPPKPPTPPPKPPTPPPGPTPHPEPGPSCA